MGRNADVVVVGGGIVGAAIAHRLAKEGLAVTLLERGEVGREASWAAGGILAPVHLAEYPPPLARLCEASARLYPALIDELRGATAIDPEYRVTGFLIVVRDDDEERHASALESWKRAHDQPVERLSREEIHARHPGLATTVRGGIFLPDIAQVRNHRMAAALIEAAGRRGVEVRRHSPVTGFLRVPGRVNGVKTPQGDVYAKTVVLAAGSWSGEVLAPLGISLPVKPVKGQILLTQAEPGLLGPIVEGRDTYLVPRADGALLVGSTMEDAGFDKTVTLEAVAGLAARAAAIVPGVARLPLVASWAGLRPSTPDRLPYIGPAPMDGLLVATGHFRNGILLAPITAELVSEIVTGRAPSIPLEPFDPARVV